MSLRKGDILINRTNSKELRSLQIPLPSLPLQQDILQRIIEGRAEVSKIRAAVQEIASDSKREIGALILGTKKVECREAIKIN